MSSAAFFKPAFYGLRETHGCARLVTHKTAYDSQRTKRAIMPFAGNAGPDQPARSGHSLSAYRINIYTSPNRECPDQTARMRTVIWTFAVGIWHKGYLPSLSIICKMFAIALFVAYIGKSTKMSNKSNVSRLICWDATLYFRKFQSLFSGKKQKKKKTKRNISSVCRLLNQSRE